MEQKKEDINNGKERMDSEGNTHEGTDCSQKVGNKNSTQSKEHKENCGHQADPKKNYQPANKNQTVDTAHND